MKKGVFYIILIVFILFSFFLVNYIKNKTNREKIILENNKYIEENGKTVQINSVVTVMNRAIESNIQNDISKDEKGLFIENDTNSIKVYLEIESRDAIIPMEDLLLSEKGGANKVLKVFPDLFFEYKNIEYHKKTGRIKKIVFKAIEEI